MWTYIFLAFILFFVVFLINMGIAILFSEIFTKADEFESRPIDEQIDEETFKSK